VWPLWWQGSAQQCPEYRDHVSGLPETHLQHARHVVVEV
jgi:hypothetical protein